MRIAIKLTDKREIDTDISEEEFAELKTDLSQGKIKFLNLENKLLKVTMIESIEPIAGQPISKEFRLQAPEFKKVESLDSFISTFDFLKSRGLFVEFKDYNDWNERRDKVKLKPKDTGGKVFLDGKIL